MTSANDVIDDNNIDLHAIDQHDVEMESEEEQTSSKQTKIVLGWLKPLVDNKLTFTFQGETSSSNWQVEPHYVQHAFIPDICDGEPLSLGCINTWALS